MTNALQVSLILPTRNEAGNIAEAIRRAHEALDGIPHEIIVVDDNSPDGTADLVRSIAADDPSVRCIQRIGRRGLASACIEGALSAAGQVVAVMDADLQHDETILPKLVQPVLSGEAELSVGTRYSGGGGTSGWSETREAQSEWATRLAMRFLKTPLSDPMSGFFAIRAETFRALIPNLSGRGFKILLDLVFASPEALTLHEEPFVFRGREKGESKLDTPTAIQYLMMLYDRVMGHIIPARFALFAIVGGLGVAVHMLALIACYQLLGMSFLAGQSVAVMSAMTFNFVLNNLLTFSDVRLKGWALLRGWVVFCLICGLGAIANVGVASYLFSETGVMWTLSALAGILVGAVWNFVMSSRFTWGQL
ncbi:MAG: dolichol monophosphate mannose synthase [Ponticaulis sp.]|nr:dolichol monophosphate mannose synthase [Ponticaulis sp.]